MIDSTTGTILITAVVGSAIYFALKYKKDQRQGLQSTKNNIPGFFSKSGAFDTATPTLATQKPNQKLLKTAHFI